jgi:hypothetical protein
MADFMNGRYFGHQLTLQDISVAFKDPHLPLAMLDDK